jgi:NAD(P)-dependent dehydrogenase (short-subunit alcohol dehydrogenase family)
VTKEENQLAPAAILMGGPRRILQATAMRLAKRNLSIIFCDPDENALRAVEAELRREGCPVIVLRVNPTVAADLRHAAETAVSRCGRIATLVNGPVEWSEQASPDGHAEASDQTTLYDCVRSTQAMAAHIATDSGGSIVHLVSSAGRYRSAYFQIGDDSRIQEAATGGAILALTRQLALELAKRRIRVNTVVSGLIEGATGQSQWDAASERDRSFILQEISVGRLGRPDEVAAAIEFLALDASSYVTGAAIDVNGGWWMS